MASRRCENVIADVVWIPAVLVALPIIAAAVPLLLGRLWNSVGWWVAAITMAIQAILAGILALSVHTNGAVHHHLGGFAPPIGIELVADALSVWFVLLIAVVALAVLAFTFHGGPRGRAFSSVYLLLIGGLMGITLTGDLFNMFVFLEITGIATYALIATRQHRDAAYAALKYLVIGTVGATLYLIGVAYLFTATGTLNMVDVSAALAGGGSPAFGEAIYDDTLVRAAFAFIFAGLATKIAQFPVHSWQPDAYVEAPDAVTILMSALVSTVAAYALIRVTFTVFTVDFFAVTPIATWAIIAVGVVSVLFGSILAVIQSRIKRMIAYSSIAQFGLIVAAIGVATGPIPAEFALAGAIIHLIGHGIMKGGLFAAAGAVAASTGARTLRDYGALARRRPWLAGGIAILGFGLIGVPPSVGFVGKWYIALGAIESEMWIVAFVVLVSTLLTLGYIARVLERMYFVLPEDAPALATADGGRSLGIGMVLAVAVAVLATVLLGFLGGPLFELVEPYVEEVLHA